MTPSQLLQPVGMVAARSRFPRLGAARAEVVARLAFAPWAAPRRADLDRAGVQPPPRRSARPSSSPSAGARARPRPVRFLEAGGIAEVLAAADAGEVDLAILDGEAQPTGGMGLSRQLKNEIDDCPPIVVTVRRRDDRWLATWSQADAVLVHPLDPLTAAETVADVLRARSLAGGRGRPQGDGRG